MVVQRERTVLGGEVVLQAGLVNCRGADSPERPADVEYPFGSRLRELLLRPFEAETREQVDAAFRLSPSSP